MLLYIVRHGKPDYKEDNLTPEGWEQARLVAKRMVASGIQEIYASPQRRARQTAQPTAEALGLDIFVEPWAEELGSETHTLWPNGKRRTVSALNGQELHSLERRQWDREKAFDKLECFQDTAMRARYQFIANGLDGFLERQGYRRNGEGFYDMTGHNEKRIALFCHAGMTRVMLSHLLQIPFQLFAGSLQGHFTGVTVVCFGSELSNCEGTTAPTLYSYCDVGHLYGEGPLEHFRDHYWF